MVTREELYFQLLDEKDVRAAERVFRKVVHPGLDSMQLVDRNRLSISSAPGYGLRQKSFVISPRGVPTRISNHVYSGYHSHYTRYDGVTGTESPEFNISQPSTGMISSRLQAYSAMPSKKRAISSKSAFRAMHMTKSATSDRYQGSISNNKRFLKSAKSDQCHKSRSDQEERLDKEWTNMSNCRALKRSSEIVSHRVDRMYYMNGNSLKLQPRYQVDEDELTQLREMSKSRQSARQQRVKQTVDFLDKYLKKMDSNTSIEDVSLPPPIPSCHMCDHCHTKSIPPSVSEESGIQEDVTREEELEFSDTEVESHGHNDNSRPVSKVEIRHVNVEDGPVNIFDILSHGEQQALGDCMVELVKKYPNKPRPKKVAGMPRNILHMGLKDRKRRNQKGSYMLLPQNSKRPVTTTPHSTHHQVSPSHRTDSKSAKQLLKKFPVRKPSARVFLSQLQEPVDCDCRKTLPGRGPPALKINGKQAPIFIRIASPDLPGN